MHHSGQVIGSAADSAGKEGVDLGPQKENESEIVEEDEQDKHAYCSPEVAEKGSHIQGKEHEIEFEQNRCNHRSKPTAAKTDFLVRDHHIDNLKQDISANQSTGDTTHAQEQSIFREMAQRRILQQREGQGGK